MQLLKELPSPLDLSKKEIIDILLHEEYGYLPPSPISVHADEKSCDKSFCAGKAILKKFTLTCKLDKGDYTFPVYFSCPVSEKPVPCFIHINFRDDVPDRYLPSEEIVDSGYAVLSFCYNDITRDNDDFTDGLAGIIYPDGKRTNDQCGKIGLWAWAAMRILDFAFTLNELDKTRISVIGHSRLGKTALLAGALDERFFCAFSNDSGCSGAAISRNKQGETIENIYQRFPFWFCENYQKYSGNENSLPFDQHFLIAANVPHKVYVASAAEDTWADPNSEYLSCVAASDYYKKNNLSGFIYPNRMPVPGDYFGDGNIGYHLRSGLHYLSRQDWQHFIKYLNEER